MPDRMTVNATLNGQPVTYTCESRQSLLEILREGLGLTGTKLGCDNGNCGACSILLDGAPVNACLVLAVEVEGRSVTTIEGLGNTHMLRILQQKFLEHAALQCGICTPGIIMMTKALLDRDPDPSEVQVRSWLAGNLCRCTGYDKIVRAVMDAAAALRTMQPVEHLP